MRSKLIAPSEAIYCGKKLLISPIKDQYEQAANAKGAQLLGIDVFESLDADGAIIWNKFCPAKMPLEWGIRTTQRPWLSVLLKT